MDNHLPTAFAILLGLLMLRTAAAFEPDASAAQLPQHSAADIQAEEERILAQHFPNKDDSDSDYDDDDDADADAYDDDDDAYDEAQAARFAGDPLSPAEAAADQPPVFLEQPLSAFCTRQQPATLRCRAAHAHQLHIVCSGHLRPPQSVQDAHVDPQSGVHVQAVIATVGADAVLRHAGVSATPFRCDCHAVSPYGKAKSQPPASVQLAYIRKPFAVQPLSMRVHEGNRTEFQCAGPRGVPAPTVDWLRNGVPVVRNDSAAAVTLAANGSLIIARTALKDIGNYTCVARNIAGSQTSGTVNLSVYVDGGWSAWSAWSDCSGCPERVSRLGRMRTRSCTQPVPLNGGAPCAGSGQMQTKDCRTACTEGKTEIVQVPGTSAIASGTSTASAAAAAAAAATASLPVWTQWTEWAECSAECIQVRRRTCTDGARRMRSDCGGREFQTQPCQGQLCAASQSSGRSWMLFLGLGAVCGACLVAGAALTRCTRKHAARLPSYRLAQTDDLQLTESSKQDMALSDWRQHQYCAVV